MLSQRGVIEVLPNLRSNHGYLVSSTYILETLIKGRSIKFVSWEKSTKNFNFRKSFITLTYLNYIKYYYILNPN